MLLGLARVHLARGEDSAAKPLLEQIQKKAPGHPESASSLLRIEADAGDDLALKKLRALAGVKESGFFGSYELGRALLARKNGAEAISAFEEAISRHAEEGHAYTELGKAKILVGDLDGAAKALRRAQELLPHDALPSVLLAQCLARLGRVGEAISVLDEAIRRDPENVATYPELARLCIFAQAFPKALHAAKELRLRRPDSADGAYLQGLASLLSGNGDEAERLFREASKLAPNSVEVKVALAKVERMKGDDAAAATLLEEAVTAAPDAPGPALDLSLLYLSQPGKPKRDRAEAVLQRALKAHPDDPALSLNLALTLADRDPGAARVHARDAAKARDADVRAQAERLLETLPSA